MCYAMIKRINITMTMTNRINMTILIYYTDYDYIIINRQRMEQIAEDAEQRFPPGAVVACERT